MTAAAAADAKSSQKRIVIVGAGLSGMSAAARLIENGFQDVVVLEVENRIGGRIKSIPASGGFIDLGLKLQYAAV